MEKEAIVINSLLNEITNEDKKHMIELCAGMGRYKGVLFKHADFILFQDIS
jgi:hypothetical protein